jgi:hypothetical protein
MKVSVAEHRIYLVVKLPHTAHGLVLPAARSGSGKA